MVSAPPSPTSLSSRELRWIIPDCADEILCNAVARATGVPPFLADLLCRRGCLSPEAATDFLDPRLQNLSDPFLLPGMEEVVERLLRAIDCGEKIALYGDYDVDGVTSLAFLYRILRAYGANVACFLPSRMDEGYGLSHEGVARCVAELQPRLLVALDCGTSSTAEIAALKRDGIETLVIDHHEPKDALPPCLAMVNPKAAGDEWRYLCTVGLVFKLAHALLKRRRIPEIDLRHYLDLVALGNVADLAPLVGENRILTRRGLNQMAMTRWPGLQALMDVAEAKPPFTPGAVGFRLGPRMNAAGRLGVAQDALDLLLTEDREEGLRLAAGLDRQNQARRDLEDAVFEAARAQVAEWFDPEQHAALVAGAPEWHPGVIGIVASRLQKLHHRPAIVIGFDETGYGKGSGRSIPGFSLVEALDECSPLLEQHGGHEMAAGLKIHRDRFEEFRTRFAECAARRLTPEQLTPSLRLDGEMPLSALTRELLAPHESLQPFGIGHPQPVFYTRCVTLAMPPRVLKEKHLLLTLRQGRHETRAIWFGSAKQDLPPQPWDVAFTIERNDFQGVVSPQMQVCAVRAAE